MSHPNSEGSGASEIDSLVEALSMNHMGRPRKPVRVRRSRPKDGTFPVEGSKYPVRSVKVDEFELDKPHPEPVEATIEQAELQPKPLPEPAPAPSVIADATSRNAPASSAVASEKLRVLVVDDDPINRTILSKRLSLDGHTVMGSTNGQEGVLAIESDRAFDCVLMDIQMPILDGFEATKRIRSIEASSSDGVQIEPARTSLELNGRIPIFAVSASLVEHQRENMSKLGLDGWILKPIDFKRLGTILRGITDASERRSCLYHPGCNWEAGGWLGEPHIRHPDPELS